MSAPVMLRPQASQIHPTGEPPALGLAGAPMAWDAATAGLSCQDGWVGRIRKADNDVGRFSTGTRRFVALLDLGRVQPVEPDATLALRPRHGSKVIARPKAVSR